MVAIPVIDLDWRWSASYPIDREHGYRCPLRTNGRENIRLSAWVDPMVTMGLYTMMERLSKSGRSHCQNRHVTNSYPCYWLPIWISPSSSTRSLLSFFLSFFIASHGLFQLCISDDILYRIMGYVRRINYIIPKAPRRSEYAFRLVLVYRYICRWRNRWRRSPIKEKPEHYSIKNYTRMFRKKLISLYK